MKKVVYEILRLRAQSTAIDSEIASLRKERVAIERNIEALEARVEKSPRREQEMVALLRDYDNLKNQYDGLLKKKLDAEVAQNLEKRQKGEQFQILDPANPPQEPFTPNRPKVFGIALAAALMAGFGGAFGWEMLNPSLRGKRDFPTSTRTRFSPPSPSSGTRSTRNGRTGRWRTSTAGSSRSPSR